MNNKKGLGKGLGALFSMYNEDIEEVQATPSKSGGVSQLDIKLIYPNPNQPRKTFAQDALKELADSIKIHGIIQPIVVNKDLDGKYMIIAGERRWRAANLVGLTEVPCVVRDYTERQIKEISIIENLQREDLNAIESARAIKQLMDEYDFTQEVVADRIGKSRPAIANQLRLLTLCPEVIQLVETNRLSAGHARCLVTISDSYDQVRFANLAVDNKISVRDLEKYIKKGNKAKKSTTKAEQPIELTALVQDLQRVFSTKVSILGNDNKGRIYIDYYSRDDLDRIAEIVELTKKKQLTLQDLNSFNKRK